MITSVNDLNVYLNNYESSEEVVALKEEVLGSAEAIVEDYLGYNPSSKYYQEELHIGSGTKYLHTKACPINNVSEVLIKDQEIEDYVIQGDSLYRKNGWPVNEEIYISYDAGYRSTKMPSIIRITILRIAALLWAETSGAIGLSARTSPDNSKTYISYTNYSKYLSPLDSYRRIRL